ncbi:Polycomb protein SCMH1 [Halotydeus destructor]|nr:Polycomb protein SCMH1 [Halotydeus destructor]
MAMMFSQAALNMSNSNNNQPESCNWCEDPTKKPSHFLTVDNVKYGFCNNDCLKEYQEAYSKVDCSHCERQVSGSPITSQEVTATGLKETRNFCCTECLQKYRIKNVQNQKLQQQSNRPQSATSSSSSLATSTTAQPESSKREHEPDSSTPNPVPKVLKVVREELKTNSRTPEPDLNGATDRPVASTKPSARKSMGSSFTKLPSPKVKVPSVKKHVNKKLADSHKIKLAAQKAETSTDSMDSEPRTQTDSPSESVAVAEKPKQTKRISINPRHHYETFGTFNWADYLEEVGGTPAPIECFRHNADSPENEFQLQMKLEAHDPRNPSSICVGTVVGILGPRIQVRLDGSDNTNDFWELVDSKNIMPIGSCEEQGGMLQPPLGFRKNPSHFHIFVANTLQGAVIAPDDCFKQTPRKPKKNHFDVGMKLEAIDKKNPRLICPATVGQVRDDEIFVTFDGWKGAFDYWTTYDSRDIFPVGWCQKAGHPLQPPGDKVCDLRKKGPNPKFILPSPLTAAVQAAEEAAAAVANGRASTPEASAKTPENEVPAIAVADKDVKVNNGVDLIAKKTLASNAKSSSVSVQKVKPQSNKNEKLKQQRQEAQEKKSETSVPNGTPKVQNESKKQLNPLTPKPVASPKPSTPKLTTQKPVPSKTLAQKLTTLKSPTSGSSFSIKNLVAEPEQQAELREPNAPAPEVVLPTTNLNLNAPISNNPLDWTIPDVMKYLINVDKSLDIHADVFRKHEIDGKAFLLLSSDMMMKYMNLKLGPALKISNIIERLKIEKKSLLMM